MTHHYYEVRLEQDLGDIKDRVSKIASLVARAIRQSLNALEHRDHQLAYRTILEDNPINRAVEDCDRACHHFVARHLPTARHLRFISSAMRLNIALERVGDYAVTVCRVAVQLGEMLDDDTLDRIKVMAVGSTEMFEQAISTFVEGNAELARGAMSFEEQIDRSFHAALDDLLVTGVETGSSTRDLFGKLVILSTLERISDQAKNICELTVFAETGQTKRRKPVPVIFIDRDNSAFGPMAVSIARKAFPGHGVYSTACLAVSDHLDGELVSRMAQSGHDLDQVSRASFADCANDVTGKTVIVVLEGEVSDYLDEVPFDTVVVRWSLPHESEGFEALYKEMMHAIRDLMTTLRGEQPLEDD